MAYLQSYNYDIFVSYSLVNNEQKMDGQPWVTELVENLSASLRGRLPRNGKDLKIFFAGKGDLRLGDQIDSCRNEARRSAIFLIIGSPRYLDFWPTSEIRAFCETPGARERIFIAEQLPLDDTQQYLEDVGDPLRQEFWRLTSRLTPTPYHLSDDCKDKLDDLAESIKDKLKALRTREETAPAQRAPNSAFRPVLLARVTDDLEEKRKRLRSHLEQFEIEVLPPADDFQEEGAEFRQEFAGYLTREPIVVQLLGPYHARRWPKLVEGFDNAQAEMAAESKGVVLRKWRDRELDVANVTDDVHLKLLSDEVDATDFEDFKEAIRRQAMTPAPPPSPPSGDSPRRSYLFIDADQSDSDTAREIVRYCRDNKIPVMLAERGVDSIKEWRENYSAADRIALIHKESKESWRDAQLRLYVRIAIKKRAPRQCLILLAGPPAKQSEDLPVYHPNFVVVDAPDGDLSPLFSHLCS